MQKPTRASVSFYATLCLVLIGVCTLAALAQSGRRVHKSQAMPLPTPNVTPMPTPVERPKPAFTFIVGLDRSSDISRVSLYSYSGVLNSCTGRLNDSPLVRADVATRDVSRSEAVRMAKAGKESYVVWLQLRAETLAGQSDISGNTNNVYLEYAVFTPTTGKTATQGNIYPNRNKRINLPTSSSVGDYYLNQAARQAAERILNHFHVSVHR